MGNTSTKRNNNIEANRGPALEQFLHRLFPNSNLSTTTARPHGALITCNEHDGECIVCMESVEVMLRLSTCSHMACVKCWLRFFCTGIESFAMARLTCVGCKMLPEIASIINLFSSAIQKPNHLGIRADETDLSSARLTSLLARYEEFLLRRALAREPDARWCPRGCGYGLIAQGYKACPQLVCLRPECQGRSFCYNCQRPWSSEDVSSTGGTSAEAHTCTVDTEERNKTMEGVFAFFGFRPKRRRVSVVIDRSPNASTSHGSFFIRETSAAMSERLDEEAGSPAGDSQSRMNIFTELSQVDDRIFPVSTTSVINEEGEEETVGSRRSSSVSSGEVKPCANCHALIQKVNDGDCNIMVCAICGYNFCWLCMQPFTTGHYLSLSGCFVRGRKRWSTRRRLLVLLCMMLGAPVFIPVLGVLLIPIGGILFAAVSSKQALKGLKTKGKFVRYFSALLAFIGGLVMGVCISGLFVAFLVPALFGYVYLYVPISMLCSINKKLPEQPVVKFSDSQLHMNAS